MLGNGLSDSQFNYTLYTITHYWYGFSTENECHLKMQEIHQKILTVTFQSHNLTRNFLN